MYSSSSRVSEPDGVSNVYSDFQSLVPFGPTSLITSFSFN